MARRAILILILAACFCAALPLAAWQQSAAVETRVWTVRISTGVPLDEALGPVGAEYLIVDSNLRGSEVAAFLQDRSAEIPYELFSDVVEKAGPRFLQVNAFEPGETLQAGDWTAQDGTYTTQIKPGPLGPISVVVTSRKAWE